MVNKAKPLGAGLAVGVFFGLSVFFLTLIGALFPGYGASFFQILIDVYPWYRVSLSGAVLGLFYGLVDGFLVGLVVVWLYNRFI